jgi:hypothetical protein
LINDNSRIGIDIPVDDDISVGGGHLVDDGGDRSI